MNRAAILIAAALMLALMPSISHASLHNCTVSVTGTSFGSYDVFALSDITSTATVTIANCTGSGSAIISLSTGLHSSNYTTRDMQNKNGSDLLDYNLYFDAGNSQVWGDGTGGTVTWQPTGNASHSLFGKIPARQTGVSTGDYGDTVGVTVNF